MTWKKCGRVSVAGPCTVTDEFRSWYGDLSRDQREAVVAAVELLE